MDFDERFKVCFLKHFGFPTTYNNNSFKKKENNNAQALLA